MLFAHWGLEWMMKLKTPSKEMKKKLETQKTILSENAVLQVSRNEKNKVLLSDINDFIEIQKQDLGQEKNKFEAFVSS